MFCPKCGAQNPENGRFCRSCGIDLGNVSDALSEKANNKNPGFGMIQPIQPMLDSRGRPVNLEGAITKIFVGIAFIAVTIALSLSQMGRGWWFWMLIPAFATLGSGIAQWIHLRKQERNQLGNSNSQFFDSRNIAQRLDQSEFDEIRNLAISGNKIEAIRLFREKAGGDLKTAKESVENIEEGKLQYPASPPRRDNYAPPVADSNYDTGGLRVPPSVTEDTTRHLEMNSEGDTMTLPPTNKI